MVDGDRSVLCDDASLAFFGVAKIDAFVGGMGETARVVDASTEVEEVETDNDRRDIDGVTACGNGVVGVDGTGGEGERARFRFPNETVKLFLICQNTLPSKASTARLRLSGATLAQSKPK